MLGGIKQYAKTISPTLAIWVTVVVCHYNGCHLSGRASHCFSLFIFLSCSVRLRSALMDIILQLIPTAMCCSIRTSSLRYTSLHYMQRYIICAKTIYLIGLFVSFSVIYLTYLSFVSLFFSISPLPTIFYILF